jgi:hypothetical protein
MGVVVVEKSGTRNPTIEAPVVEAAVVEEEAKIEEINPPGRRKRGASMRPGCEKAGQRVGVL